MIKKIKIEGMHCSSCALDIELTLEEISGVRKVDVNFPKSELTMEYDENQIEFKKIEEKLVLMGYNVGGE